MEREFTNESTNAVVSAEDFDALWQPLRKAATQGQLSANAVERLLAMSHHFSESGDWLRAWKSLRIARTAVGHLNSMRLEADTSLQCGVLFHARGRGNRALCAWERAAKLFAASNDAVGEAQARCNAAAVLRSLGRFDRALELLERSLAVAEQTGNEELIAACLNQQGLTRTDVGETLTAWNRLARATKIFRRLGDQRAVGGCYANLASLALSRGRRRTARALFERAGQIIQTLNDPGALAEVEIGLGLIADTEGHAGEARRRFESARQLSQSARDAGRDGSALQNLASISREEGHLSQAREFVSQAARQFEAAGDIDKFLLCRIDLAWLDRLLGNFGEARDCLEDVINRSRALGHRRHLAHALADLGAIHVALADRTAAETALTEADALMNESGNSIGRLAVMSQLGELARRRNALEEAANWHIRSLELACHCGSAIGETGASSNLAVIRRQQGKYQQALEQHDAAVSLAKRIDRPDILWRVLAARADTFLTMGELLRAERDLQQAVSIIEGVRERLTTEGERIGFFGSEKPAVFQAWVRVLWRRGQWDEAFGAVERARSRALLDLLERSCAAAVVAPGQPVAWSDVVTCLQIQ